MKPLQILPFEKSDIPTVVKIAKTIWHQHYDPIIGKQQVDYMLEKFQSARAIQEQITDGYQYYQVLENDQTIGYFAVQVQEQTDLFISKFYLSEAVRGKGFGRTMLKFIEQLAKQENCTCLKLTVNKYNPAYQAYLKLGFKNYGTAKFDIGSGYIMDDYLMSKSLLVH